MSADSADYFRKRESQERQLTEGATSHTIRAIHLDMAARYRRLAGERDGPILSVVPRREAPGVLDQ